MKNRLIAHRGDMVNYPENSMMAIQSAINLEFSCIEIDIQLSKEAVPIVIHDDNLQRTTCINKNIHDLTSEQINTYLVNHLNSQKHDVEKLHIPTLQFVVDRLNNYPEITLFVEIKKHSIEYFGLQIAVDAVLKVLKQAKFNVVIISFVAEVISLLEAKRYFSLGWVVSEFDQQYKQQVQQMQPDFLFCNVNKISHLSDLWRGSWQWVLYDIRDPVYTSELLAKGVQFIEMGDIVKLANAKEFQ